MIAAFGQPLFLVVAFINTFLAVFNMIPFGVMDGLKVFMWNKIIWAITFAAAAALTVYTYASITGFI